MVETCRPLVSFPRMNDNSDEKVSHSFSFVLFVSFLLPGTFVACDALTISRSSVV